MDRSFNLLGEEVGVADEDKPSVHVHSVNAMSVIQKLSYEKELLGFYISGHPMDAYLGIDYAIDSFANHDELVRIEDRKSLPTLRHHQ